MKSYNLKNKFGCTCLLLALLVILSCLYYVLFELEVQKGDEYVAYLINDNEANANNDTAAFVYDSNEYCFLHPATGYYYRGKKTTEPIGLMKIKGLFYRNRRCELYSFDGDKTSMFLCYDFNDTFFGAKTCYRDDFIIPEVSLKTIEKIELFKGNSNLIVEDTMNNMEADFLVVEKETISNILSAFEDARKNSIPGQYIITDIDSEKLLGVANGNHEEFSIASGHFYVVVTFNNYPREFCCLLGEFYTK